MTAARRPVAATLAVLAIGPTLAILRACDLRDPRAPDVASEQPASPPATVTAITGPALPSLPTVAVRAGTIPPATLPATTLPAPAGVWGLPFAPDGLDDCGQARYYRQQFGLPDEFDRLAYRESRCIQSEQVRTWCCVGRWQLYVSLHLRDHRLTLRYEACGVFSEWDVDGPEPLEQQRSACATRALFDVVGLDAWAMP